jgi:membrane fusion protein
MFSWLIATSVVAALALSFTGTYARKETVAGYLTPTLGTSKVFAPQQGSIKGVYVVEGQDVTQGQPLLTVETSQVADNDQDVNAEIIALLRSQEQLIQKQIIAEEERISSERERLTEKISNLETETVELQNQIDAQRKRVQISQEFATAAEQLQSKNVLADAELKKRQLVVIEQQQHLAKLAEETAARRVTLTEARYDLQQLPTVMAGKIQSLQNELSATKQRINEINGRRAYVLRAPATGRVSTLQATVGQFADPKRLQLEIVPLHSKLEAQLFVPARAIGFVKQGQQVRILYDAFPYQRFGAYSGRIITVSQTLLTRNDASGPVALNEPAYRVTATLDRPDVDAQGRKIPLQADMLLRADIILERRSLVAWLLDPLLSIRM